jgi:hypothetical protein
MNCFAASSWLTHATEKPRTINPTHRLHIIVRSKGD